MKPKHPNRVERYLALAAEGLSQRAIAKELGISTSALSAWRQRHLPSAPPPTIAVKIGNRTRMVPAALPPPPKAPKPASTYVKCDDPTFCKGVYSMTASRLTAFRALRDGPGGAVAPAQVLPPVVLPTPAPPPIDPYMAEAQAELEDYLHPQSP